MAKITKLLEIVYQISVKKGQTKSSSDKKAEKEMRIKIARDILADRNASELRRKKAREWLLANEIEL